MFTQLDDHLLASDGAVVCDILLRSHKSHTASDFPLCGTVKDTCNKCGFNNVYDKICPKWLTNTHSCPPRPGAREEKGDKG